MNDQYVYVANAYLYEGNVLRQTFDNETDAIHWALSIIKQQLDSCLWNPGNLSLRQRRTGTAAQALLGRYMSEQGDEPRDILVLLDDIGLFEDFTEASINIERLQSVHNITPDDGIPVDDLGDHDDLDHWINLLNQSYVTGKSVMSSLRVAQKYGPSPEANAKIGIMRAKLLSILNDIFDFTEEMEASSAPIPYRAAVRVDLVLNVFGTAYGYNDLYDAAEADTQAIIDVIVDKVDRPFKTFTYDVDYQYIEVELVHERDKNESGNS